MIQRGVRGHSTVVGYPKNVPAGILVLGKSEIGRVRELMTRFGPVLDYFSTYELMNFLGLYFKKSNHPVGKECFLCQNLTQKNEAKSGS